MKPVLDGTRTQMRLPIYGIPPRYRHGDVAAVTDTKGRWAISRCEMIKQVGVYPAGGIQPDYQVGDKLCAKGSMAGMSAAMLPLSTLLMG
jgi:hypothetical protein